MKFKVLMMLTFLFILGISGLTAADKVITLTTLDWEPYIGQSMPGQGYIAEVVKEAFTRVGYKVNIKFLPWARAVNEAETGSADGLFPEYMGDERKALFLYSEAMPGGPLGFYKKKSSAISYKTLNDLKPYKIGVVRDYINTAEFDAAKYLKKDEADSDEINIKKLINGRVDLVVIDRLVGDYLITQKFPENKAQLEFVNPPLELKPLYIVFSKKAPNYQTKLEDFNKGLKEITKDGTLKKILTKHGVADKVK